MTRAVALRLLGAVVLAGAPLAFVYAGLAPAWCGLFAVLAALAFLFWHLPNRVEGVMLVFVGVLLATTIAGRPWPKIFADTNSSEGAEALGARWAAGGQFDDRLPVVLHLIFDEMASTGALDESLPGGVAARGALYEMAGRHGLRTFDSVYSRYFFSGVSIPNMVNAEYLGHAAVTDRSMELLETIPDNAYFDAMAARGYRTIVFQTSHLDFCANPRVRHCETFASFDFGVGRDDTIDARSRTLHVWNTLLRSYEPSYVSQLGLHLLSWFYDLGDRPVGVLGIEGRFDVQRFPDWFSRFTSFVERVPRGTHVFAHFMAPHSPYLLTEGCVVSGTFAAGYYLARWFPDERDRAAARERYYRDYLAQLNCVRSRLDSFLDAVSRAPLLRDAAIIVHGDHGSRISSGNVVEQYTRRDFVDNYATYFAVKAPGIEPGIDCALQSLPEAFRRFVPGSVDLEPLDGARLSVVVNTTAGEGRKVETGMPEFGCAARPQ